MRASVGKSTIRSMAPAKTPNKPVRTANLAWRPASAHERQLVVKVDSIDRTTQRRWHDTRREDYVCPCRLGDDVPVGAVPGLRRAVVSEYRRVMRPPWDIPTALVTNGALMAAAWFLLPPRAHAFMFSLNGPLAFPVILAS